MGKLANLHAKDGGMISKLNAIVLRLWHEVRREEGQDLIEYAMLTGLIALACVSAIKPFGSIIYQYYIYLHTALKPYM